MAGTNLFLDTGPLVAYLNAADQWHDWAKSQWDEVFDPMATCDSVLSEAIYLLQSSGLSTGPLVTLFERGAVVLDFNLEQELTNVCRLLRKYADQPMSLADACLVRMSELTDRCRVFTTDSDFSIYKRHGRNQIPLLAPF